MAAASSAILLSTEGVRWLSGMPPSAKSSSTISRHSTRHSSFAAFTCSFSALLASSSSSFFFVSATERRWETSGAVVVVPTVAPTNPLDTVASQQRPPGRATKEPRASPSTPVRRPLSLQHLKCQSQRQSALRWPKRDAGTACGAIHLFPASLPPRSASHLVRWTMSWKNREARHSMLCSFESGAKGPSGATRVSRRTLPSGCSRWGPW